jgi:hypothetical protein
VPVTVPEIHTPFTAKQPTPVVISIPLAKVDVAAVPVMFKYAAFTPAVKVEVALPDTVRTVPTLRAPEVVAFVTVARRPVKFCKVEEPFERRFDT